MKRWFLHDWTDEELQDLRDQITTELTRPERLEAYYATTSGLYIEGSTVSSGLDAHAPSWLTSHINRIA